jgi:hypothetical protein
MIAANASVATGYFFLRPHPSRLDAVRGGLNCDDNNHGGNSSCLELDSTTAQ